MREHSRRSRHRRSLKLIQIDGRSPGTLSAGSTRLRTCPVNGTSKDGLATPRSPYTARQGFTLTCIFGLTEPPAFTSTHSPVLFRSFLVRASTADTALNTSSTSTLTFPLARFAKTAQSFWRREISEPYFQGVSLSIRSFTSTGPLPPLQSGRTKTLTPCLNTIS